MIQEKIKQKLNKIFEPVYLDVINESHFHHVPQSSESHFKVVIVSPQFLGLKPLVRHRMVYNTLAEELSNGIHALALNLYTLQEWEEISSVAPVSPGCVRSALRS